MTLSSLEQESTQNIEPSQPTSHTTPTEDPVATLQDLLLGSEVNQWRETIAYLQSNDAHPSNADGIEPEWIAQLLARLERQLGTQLLLSKGRFSQALMLQEQAQTLVRSLEPTLTLNSQISTVRVPPHPSLTTAEVEQTVNIFNEREGNTIRALYDRGGVAVTGTVTDASEARQVTQAFKKIPGVESVTNTVGTQPLKIDTRIDFKPGSAEIESIDLETKVTWVKRLLDENPAMRIEIIGYSDELGPIEPDRQLALKRALAVRKVLLDRQIDPARIEVSGKPHSPQDLPSDAPSWQKRCVSFSPFDR